MNRHEPPFTVDLTNCDREPIHVPGAIQPHGLLLVLEEPSLRILQASENVGDLMGIPIAEVLGEPLSTVLDAASAEAVREALASHRAEKANPLRLLVRDQRKNGILHRQEGVAILEIESAGAGAAEAGAHDPTRFALVQVESARTLSELREVIVSEVRRLTGFERVMFYRFDEEGHGSVDAENKVAALEPYLGLHYPASDIPKQARELYLRNWLRIIPDARYTPVRIVPALRPDNGAPLDLTFCVLRSVSPIHLEYVANMGIRAAMSISLVVRGRLWGLISCANHSGPRFVPYEIRSACEMLGRLASLQIGAFEDREVASQRESRRGTEEALDRAMRAGDDVLKSLVSRPAELLSLVAAGGAAIVHGDAIATCGLAPSHLVVRTIADWLDARDDGAGTIFSTASLSGLIPAVLPHKDVASGMLALALPGLPRRRLLWFRPEMVQTVSWGGDPHKPVEPDDGRRLHPRRSFEMWKEELRLQSLPWSAADVEAAEDLRRQTVEVDLGRQLVRAQKAIQARDDLVAVVSHDLKNPLGVIQLQTALLLRAALRDDLEPSRRVRAGAETIQRSVSRMDRLIHDLLDLAKIEAGQFAVRCTPDDIAALTEEALLLLRPLAEGKDVALVDEGPLGIRVMADRERIFQVLSNLLGNAVHYTPVGGTITLWAERRDSEVLVSVTDSGAGVAADQLPFLFERYWQARRANATGSGLGLFIAKGIVEAHGGRIWAESPPGSGARFLFTLRAAPE